MMGIEDTPGETLEEKLVKLEKRVKDLEDHLQKAVEYALARFEAKFAEAKGDTGGVPEPVAHVGKACPEHPEFPVTELGCTHEGCTYK